MILKSLSFLETAYTPIKVHVFPLRLDIVLLREYS